MEDILASIRRILSEDEAGEKHEAADGQLDPGGDVLALDASMLVPEASEMPEQQPIRAADPAAKSTHTTDAAKAREPEREERPATDIPGAAASADHAPPPAASAAAASAADAAEPHRGLVAPEAASAASAAMAPLLRRLSADRSATVGRGGPSIEDIVRDEMRPMLKQWLDTHLPAIVERVVRVEVERVVSNAEP
ncbi:MAG TPA: DUF2497 domain-containing protein [Acetobacteraceae bacterium]|nr:DUF2497 domain-containing protein [Acetobacteraceae bacterium]